ncbi:MAG: protein phosphatase 2C domain-containing protein [Patescibacteria group bacterium]
MSKIRLLLILIVVAVISIIASMYIKPIKQPGQHPVTHDTVLFDTSSKQAIAQGDKLTGKGIPNGKVTLIISPGGVQKDLTVDANGDWFYQIEQPLQAKKYRLSVLTYDVVGTLVNIKSFPIEITSPTSSLFLPEAKAQEEGPTYTLLRDHYPDYDEHYKDWEKRMRKIQIYPVWDEAVGETVFLNTETFLDSNVCRTQDCAIDARQMSEVELADELTNVFVEYVQALGDVMLEQCYVPFVALEQHFPDIELFRQYPSLSHYFDEGQLRGQCITQIKRDIEVADLENIIESERTADFFTQKLNERGLNEARDPVIRAFIGLDGLLNTHLVLKFIAQNDGYRLSDDDKVDLALALFDFIPFNPLKFAAIVDADVEENPFVPSAYAKHQNLQKIVRGSYSVNPQQAAANARTVRNTVQRRGTVSQSVANAAINTFDSIRRTIPPRGKAGAKNIGYHSSNDGFPTQDWYFKDGANRKGSVFDGVSTGDGGPAARLASSTIEQKIAGIPDVVSYDQLDQVANILRDAYNSAHRQVRTLGGRRLTTAVTSVIVDTDQGPHAIIANVGDARAYLYREGRLQQLSRDDRGAAEHIVTQTLGQSGTPNVHIHRTSLQPEDRIVLMSDGIFDDNPLDELEAVLRSTDANKGDLAEALTRIARKSDDKTAVVLEVYPSRTTGNLHTVVPKRSAAPSLAAGAAVSVITLGLLSTSVSSVGPTNPSIPATPTVTVPIPNQITIHEVNGQFVPGGRIVASTFLSKDGTVLSHANYNFVWGIDQPKDKTTTAEISPLPEVSCSRDSCTMKLPQDVRPGKHSLVVYVTQRNDSKVLAASSKDITIGSTSQTSACPETFFRCGGKPGYETYERHHRIYVEPICTGSDVTLRKEDLGEDRTDCPQ